MESKDYNLTVNSLEEQKNINENFKILLEKNTSLSYEEQKINKKEIDNINYTTRKEENIQNNIFDHDVSINYVRNRHKNLHLKKPKSKYKF